jgi:ferredoxin
MGISLGLWTDLLSQFCNAEHLEAQVVLSARVAIQTTRCEACGVCDSRAPRVSLARAQGGVTIVLSRVSPIEAVRGKGGGSEDILGTQHNLFPTRTGLLTKCSATWTV